MEGIENVKYNYAITHIAVHMLIAVVIYFTVQLELTLDYVKLLLIGLGTAVVDLDHLMLWREKGMTGYLYLRTVLEFGKPRKYGFHNFMILFGTFGGSLLILVYDYFYIGLFFAAAALHLLWDLAEDLLIFKMGYRHWI